MNQNSHLCKSSPRLNFTLISQQGKNTSWVGTVLRFMPTASSNPRLPSVLVDRTQASGPKVREFADVRPHDEAG